MFTGSRVAGLRPDCYHYFVGVNTQRADLGLPQFDLPPGLTGLQSQSGDGVGDYLSACGRITLKLRVTSPPAQYTRGAWRPAGQETGVRFAHSTTLSWGAASSDITDLFVAR